MTRGFVAFLAAAALCGPALAQPAATPAPTAPAAPAAQEQGEPLPPGVPTDPYELTGWCYGALGQYLQVYEVVIPDLRDIDRMYGSSVQNEAQPYAEDVAEARQALRRFAAAMEAAERASPRPIAPNGARAIQRGRSIWSIAQRGSRRSLARAWLYWGIPDRCDSVARELYARSTLAAPALSYNARGEQSAPEARPAAVNLAPITAPLPQTDEPIAGAVMGPPLPPSVTPPRSTVVASAPPTAAIAQPSPARPSRIVEDAPVSTAPAAAPEPAAATASAAPAPAPPPAAAAAPPELPAMAAAPSPEPITTAAAPPPPAAVASAPPAPTVPRVSATGPIAPPTSDEPQEPML